MRLFACTHLNTDNQLAYGRLAADLVARSRGRVRSVPERSLHITHAFLPDVPSAAVPQLVKALETVGSKMGAIPIRLGPPRVRYARAAPRLVDVSVVEGDSAVEGLTAEVAAALAGCLSGGAVERARPAHVTIVRFGRQAGPDDGREVEALLQAWTAQSPPRDDHLAAVQLVSSVLADRGPAYTILADFPLLGNRVS